MNKLVQSYEKTREEQNKLVYFFSDKVTLLFSGNIPKNTVYKGFVVKHNV